jgi:isopenicillin N synthase-like dioxygenase
MNNMTATQVGYTVFSQEEFQKPKLDDKFRQAIKDGFFYLEIPEACRKILSEGVGFANSFYEREDVKNRKLKGFGGYHDREDSGLQIQSHYAERTDWETLAREGIYSKEQVNLAKRMHKIGPDVLTKSLQLLDIPESEWSKLTGKLSQEEGTVHFSANHYRSEIECPGLSAHRDIGFVTVLFINQLGLEAEHNKEWKSVPPLEGHFVINFGRNLEIATGNRGLVDAAWHRVCQVVKDRTSFGVFLDGGVEEPVYSYDGKTCTEKYPSTQKYMDECFKEVYKS